MSLMGFLSSPLGTIVSSTAEDIGERYFQVVEKDTGGQVQNIIDVIKATKKAKDAAVSTGSALNSQFAAQATSLSTVEGFENASQADLIATIKSVEDAGLAKKGEAVKYIMENPSRYTIDIKPKEKIVERDGKKYKVVKKDGKNVAIPIDTSAQTQVLFAGGPKITTEPTKERGLIQQLLHGPGIEEIRDIALSKMGMTREEYNALMSPVVRKKLNIGESTIKLSIKKEISPLVVSLQESMVGETSETINTLGGSTFIPNIDMDVKTAAAKMIKIVNNKPNFFQEDEEYVKLSTALDAHQFKLNNSTAAAAAIIENSKDTFVNAHKFVSNPKNSTGLQTEVRSILKNINTTKTAIRNAVQNNNLTQINSLTKDLNNFIMELSIDVATPPVEISSTFMDEVTSVKEHFKTLSPNQIINGKSKVKAEIEFNKKVAAYKDNVQNMSIKERNDAENKLLNEMILLRSTLPTKIGEGTEDAHSNLMDLMKNQKIDLNKIVSQKLPSGLSQQVTINEIFNNEYLSLYNDIVAGRIPPGSLDVAERRLQLIRTEILSGSTTDAEKTSTIKSNLELFSKAIDSSEKSEKNAYSIVVSQLQNNELNATQADMVTVLQDKLRDKDNSIRDAIANEDSDVDKQIANFNSTRANMISYITKAARFTDKNYDSSVETMKVQMKKLEDAFVNKSEMYTVTEHVDILNLLTQFSGAMKTNVMDNKAKEENLKTLNEIVAKSLALTVKADKTPMTTLEEKTQAILDMELAANPGMTELQQEVARVTIKGMIAQGNVLTTKDGTFLRSFNPETNEVELIQVSSYTGAGGKITLDRDQREANTDAIKLSLEGEQVVGSLINTFIEHPNAFNTVGDIQLFGLNVADLFTSMGKSPTSIILGKTKEELSDIQQARTNGYLLLAKAKEVLFKSDPRLSDRDMAIVKGFILVLEDEKLNLLGTTRGQAALSIIQAAMTKDAMLRKYDADFDNKVPISEAFETKPDAEVASMSTPNEYIYKIEKRLNFKIGEDSGPSLAKEAFYNILKSYNVHNFATPAEAKKMSKKDQDLYIHKINLAISQMQFIMSDIYIYSSYGEKDRNKVVNQFLQNYSDLEGNM